PSALPRFTDTPYLEELRLAVHWLRFRPGMLSRKGGRPLRRSGRVADSTRTTVAPWSANAFAVIGPAPTQEKSTTFSPANASPSRSASTGGGSGAAASDVHRAATSSPPSSSAGAAGPRRAGVRESRKGGPG